MADPKNTHGHWIVTPNQTNGGLGSSNSSELIKSFPGSPIHSGEMTDETVIQQAQEKLLDGNVTDDGVYGTVNRDYTGEGVSIGGPPNHDDISTDSEGRELSSPFAPSLASPPGGADDWKNQEPTPEATEQAGTFSAGPFPNHDREQNPQKSSNLISGMKIGSLSKGSSVPPSTT